MEPTSHPKVWARCELFSSETLTGTRKDLLKLTCNPLESEKLLSRPLRLKRVVPEASKISRVSSAFALQGNLLQSPH